MLRFIGFNRVPHIFAKNEKDLYYVTGYIIATGKTLADGLVTQGNIRKAFRNLWKRTTQIPICYKCTYTRKIAKIIAISDSSI
jgi:hypothetical protein